MALSTREQMTAIIIQSLQFSLVRRYVFNVVRQTVWARQK